jgi:hypothetical protein
MKWFKHMTDASHGATLSLMRQDLGWGYVERYWILCELIARCMNVENGYNPTLITTERQLKTNLGLKQNKLSLFLVYLDNKLKINSTLVNNVLTIRYDNMLKLKDNSAKSLLSRGKQKVNVEIELDKEKDKKKKKKGDAYKTQIEDLFKNSYPRQEGKTRGVKVLTKQIKTEQDLADLEQAITNYAEKIKQENIQDRFIKHFSSFAECWREFIDYSSAPKQIKINWKLDELEQ